MNGSTTNGGPDGCRGPTSGLTLLEAVIVVVIVVVVVAILLPVFSRTDRGGARRETCLNNMKDLGTALYRYQDDYSSGLPSSFLYGRSKTWNAADFAHFAAEKGKPPLDDSPGGSTWVSLLYPYMDNKDGIWCPSDPAKNDLKNRTVSYFYKAAVDRAWYDAKAQKKSDFEFPADQVVFYEHNDWHHKRHWWESDNGVALNMTYLDGHVSTKRIKDSSGPAVTSAPAAGEPAWFNYDGKHEKAVGVGQYFDPHVYYDDLP